MRAGTNTRPGTAASIRAGGRFSGLFVLCLIFTAVQTVFLVFHRGRASYYAPTLWHKAVCALFGVRIEVTGTPERQRQVIYAANHLSYIDIPVMGSLVRGSLVSRGDIEKWPGWGYFGKMQQTVYISRDRKDTLASRKKLEKKIAEGKNLIIFPEATSSDGSKVLPFKSSFFGVAVEAPEGRAPLIQPVTIALLEADGKPAEDSAVRDLYAWHGDMTLPPHFWRFAQMKGVKVRVHFHPPRDAALYPDRKMLCSDCHRDVASGLERLARTA